MTDCGEEAEVVQEDGTQSYEVQTADGKYCRSWWWALIDLLDANLIDLNETSDTVTNETNMVEANIPLHRSGREKYPSNRLVPSWNTWLL